MAKNIGRCNMLLVSNNNISNGMCICKLNKIPRIIFRLFWQIFK